MPRCPFWPASIGCLILVISTTRSASVDEVGVGVAAGDDDVLVPRSSGENIDDVGDIDPAPLHRVRELVQDIHAEALSSQVAFDLLPAFLRVGSMVVGVTPLNP